MALTDFAEICYSYAMWVSGGREIGKSTSGQLQDVGRHPSWKLAYFGKISRR